MGRLFSLLIFYIIVNATIPYVAGLGLFFFTGPHSYAGISGTNILSVNGCSVSVNGTMNCNPQLPQAAGSLPNLLVFGDYFDAFVNIIKSLGTGILLPGYILLQLGFPSGLVAVYALGTYIIFGYFVYDAISGRNQSQDT